MTSTAADTFARFVAVLADSMDDHDTDGEALASSVHLSRFHCDRLVSAAAGEPPAALRRRILLERAAYQLITTDHDILRVAVEAGYASNEAFTRAFRRAFGLAPSRWRARPTTFRLAGPEPGALQPARGPARPRPQEGDCDGPAHPDGRAPRLAGRRARGPVRAGSRRSSSTRPVEISVDGIDDEPTVLSLLARLVGQMAMWDAATHDRPYDIGAERSETLDDVRAKLAEVGPAFLDQVRAIVAEGRLDETFVDALCDPPQIFTYGGMVAHVLTFAAHRRVLVCGALVGRRHPRPGRGRPDDLGGPARLTTCPGRLPSRA